MYGLNSVMAKNVTVVSLVAALFSVSAIAAQKRPPMPVPVVVVKKTDVPVTYEYPARTQAAQQVSVVAQVSGILEKKYYQDGDKVKAGQDLYLIDPRRYQAKVVKAKAQVDVEEAKVKQAEREYKRVKGLYKNKAVSEQEMDNALSSFELAKAGLEGAKASLSDAQIDLGYTKVKAEISGFTSQKLQDVGSLVGTAASNSMLTTITNLDVIYANFSIPDSDMSEQRSLVASHQLEMPKDRKFDVEMIGRDKKVIAKGVVDFTDSRIDTNTGSVVARATFANANHVLLPGEFVRVRLSGAKRLGVFTIPQKAVLQIGQQAFVYVVKNGVVNLMPIQLATTNGDQFLVTGGLKEGDQVVIANLIKLRPNTPVSPIVPKASEQKKQPK
ncbi:efflux RND transporter periplasmic adaptor subunit [Hydrogenovibrio kuenenii]|uniref:efflux RND transporter periplasmic adaptor subunit n=1 Tax=Hydrogenovibrio kuenenii TaxID=63658 RepID=UPI00046561F8|nr:efflux RND transporter periplasmic adaptor subunit [Hydrogenovibrio kuenenii]